MSRRDLRRRAGGSLRATLAVLALATTAAAAMAPAAAAERPAQQRETARSYFTDTVLVDQHGKEVRFYSDLMDGKVVVIDSMFTTCVAVCPVISKKMKAIAEAAGDRLGRDVQLISISVDPAADTPAKLRDYATRNGAPAKGWSFLTGSPDNVQTVLGKLGFAVEDKDAHSTLVLMGNERTGLWKKANGLASPAELVEIFESVLDDRGAPAQGGAGAAGGAR
jgi:protein SCO1/2